MRRLFRRGAHQADEEAAPDTLAYEGDVESDTGAVDEFEPFVPVRGGYEPYEQHEDSIATAYSEPDDQPRRRRMRVSMPRVPSTRLSEAVAVRWDLLLWVVILVLTGIVGTLLVRGEVSGDVETWWPVVVIAFAVAWMLIALLRRHVTSFLGAAAVAGVGLSLIMDAQDIARFEETLLGVVLVTIGLGVVIRGLLLRQRSPL